MGSTGVIEESVFEVEIESWFGLHVERASMKTFHDRRTGRTVVTQEAHPVVASVVLAGAIGFVALCVAMPFIEKDPGGWLWLLEAMCIAFVGFLLRMSVQTFTEIVAAFDGNSRTVTVSRTRPWRHAEQIVRYEDVVEVASRTRTIIAPDASWFIWVARFHSLVITLADGRRIRLQGDEEAECDEAARQINRLIHEAGARSKP
jgi:hypothetical protein